MNASLKTILEAAMMASGEALSMEQFQSLFPANQSPKKQEILEALKELQQDYEDRGLEVIEIASGYTIRVRESYAGWISKLWEEKPQKHSRALLETLALIAYRQPITRAEIEKVRGVAVSAGIMKTLMEREWIRIVGYRDVPGKPGLYATTKTFLDFFSLKSLDELPPLEEILNLEEAAHQFELALEGIDDTSDMADNLVTDVEQQEIL